MTDINNDLRLVIDTGKYTIGNREVIRSISDSKAKVIVLASKGKKEIAEDILHLCSVAKLRVIKFSGNSLELGTLCGKPYSVTVLAVLEPGNSNILNEEYE
ncbi:MAG: 50S ribosomal protein L30e [Candidatus Micrarchaeia archaeon]